MLCLLMSHNKLSKTQTQSNTQQKQTKIINFTSSLSPFMDKALLSAHFCGFRTVSSM